MKRLLSAVLAGALLFTVAPVSYSEPRPEPRKVAPGTEVRLHIINEIGTTVSRNGEQFVAVVSEPVFVGNTLLIPAGTKSSRHHRHSRARAALLRFSWPGLHGPQFPQHRN